ncbi:MAG: ABC transporter substrate-binding protein [Treponema sp.]|nr:ABC transporter substrate-binding protein [Treponema sp.]
MKTVKFILVILAIFSVIGTNIFAGGSRAASAPTGSPGTVRVLRVGVPDMPDTLDPGIGIGNVNNRVLFNIFDMILYADSTRNGELSTYIAEEYRVIDDFTTEIRLKSGITFHNGDPLTAEDIKYTIERIVFGDPSYFGATIRTLLPNIEEVQVVDRYTARVKTVTPDPVMLNRLSSTLGIHVVPKNYIESVGNEAFGQAPIGTGPYRVVSMAPERIVLEYYEGYFGQRPAADRLEFLLYPEVSTRIAALRTGEIDICLALTPDDMPQFRSAPGFRFERKEREGLQVLCFNSSVAPMDDANLRRALNISIDRSLLVETLWHGQTSTPNGWNIRDYGPYYLPDYPEYAYDLARARQYLAASRYNGEPIIFQLIAGMYPMGVEVAEAIVSNWRSIGINASLQIVTSFDNDAFHIRNWANGPRFLDPVAGLWLLWGPGTLSESHYWRNANGWDEFVQLGRLLETSSDFERRFAANRRMMELWDNEAVGTILYHSTDFYALRDSIRWSHHSGSSSISFRAEHLQITNPW